MHIFKLTKSIFELGNEQPMMILRLVFSAPKQEKKGLKRLGECEIDRKVKVEQNHFKKYNIQSHTNQMELIN